MKNTSFSSSLSKKLRIGLDLHNLSARDDAIVRTGIQQVVFHLLSAQYRFRKKSMDESVEIIPLPMLPFKVGRSRFSDIVPLHGNSTPFVLSETEKEFGVPREDLWADDPSPDGTRWKQSKFYRVAATLDWIIFTGLCDFRFMIEEIRRFNPKIKVAVLIYDLIPLILPETTAKGMSQWFYRSIVNSIFHEVDIIFTDSRHTAIDCEKYFSRLLGRNIPIISSPISSEVPSICDEDLSVAHDLLDSLGVEKGRYFVCIGTIEPRKNLKIAIVGFLRALELFPELGGYKLLLIGTRGWNAVDSELRELIGIKKSNIMLPGYLEKKQMEIAIFFSSALLMPSRYEGYGMPLRLALNLGVPLITCINSSLPEASGFEAYYSKTDSPDEIALILRLVAIDGKAAYQADSNLSKLNQRVQNEWFSLFKNWIEVLKNYSGIKSDADNGDIIPSFPQYCSAKEGKSRGGRQKVKIVLELHNLSLEVDRFEKSGIQSVVFNLLATIADIRGEYKDAAELICLPLLPDDPFFVPTYAPSVRISPSVIKEVEKEAGCDGEDLWGFNLGKLNYQVDSRKFMDLVKDSDWFSITSQFDVRRVYRYLTAASQNVRISHIVYDIIPSIAGIFVPKTLEDWFTQSYLGSVRKYSSLVSCISRHSAINFLDSLENRDKIAFPVYSQRLPVDEFFLPGLEKSSRRPFSGEMGRYILVIGNTDHRKNIKRLIDAFLHLHQRYKRDVMDLKLVSVGPKVWRTSDIMEKFTASSADVPLLELGYVDEQMLRDLISNSSGVVMPSRYEGFGLPLAQARSLNIPVMTCVNSSLPEVSGLSAVFVDPLNIEEMALGLLELSRRRKIENGGDASDSWKSYVRDFIELHLKHL
ncbi:MAG: glycosyltransferase [Oligoflexales bacterium]|nr:glycosyltransferase [Oligoflexales bacterium]